jgi:hypothetical protein
MASAKFEEARANFTGSFNRLGELLTSLNRKIQEPSKKYNSLKDESITIDEQYEDVIISIIQSLQEFSGSFGQLNEKVSTKLWPTLIKSYYDEKATLELQLKTQSSDHLKAIETLKAQNIENLKLQKETSNAEKAKELASALSSQQEKLQKEQEQLRLAKEEEIAAKEGEYSAKIQDALTKLRASLEEEHASEIRKLKTENDNMLASKQLECIEEETKKFKTLSEELKLQKQRSDFRFGISNPLEYSAIAGGSRKKNSRKRKQYK